MKRSVNIRFEQPEYELLDLLAKEQDTTVTDLVQQFVLALISRVPPEERQRLEEERVVAKRKADLAKARRFFEARSAHLTPMPDPTDPNPQFADTPERAMSTLVKELRK